MFSERFQISRSAGIRRCLLAVWLAATAPLEQVCADVEDLEIFGWVEQVEIGAEGRMLALKGKLDTGARSSSLHAVRIERFDKEGKPWVRFSLAWDDEEPQERIEPVTFERPWVDDVLIKRHKRASQRRPVVEMDLCLGGERRTIEVNLIDRSRFHYPLLLGRRTLAGWGVIDPARSYLQSVVCPAD